MNIIKINWLKDDLIDSLLVMTSKPISLTNNFELHGVSYQYIMIQYIVDKSLHFLWITGCGLNKL